MQANQGSGGGQGGGSQGGGAGLISFQSTPTFSLSTQQQKQLLETYDELLKHITQIRSNVSDFYSNFIADVKNNPTITIKSLTHNKEEFNEHVRAGWNRIHSSLEKAENLSKKVTQYSIPISFQHYQTIENSWGQNYGLYDPPNIAATNQLRNENHWKYSTSQKANSILTDFENELNKQFPNLFKENEENTSMKKRKQSSLTSSPALLQQQLSNTPQEVFKLPTPPSANQNSLDYFSNLDRIIQSAKNEFVLMEINKIGSQAATNSPPKGLFVDCPDVFKCLIYFAMPEENKSCFAIERITVFASKESFDSFFVSSKYNIFKKLSENAFEAVSYYTSNPSGSVLKNILLWLWSFRGLFLEECKGCMNILNLDSSLYMYLPPSFRTYDTYTPYHPQCYHTHLQQLNQSQQKLI